MKHKKIVNKERGIQIWYPELSNISAKAEIGERTIIHSHVWIGDGVKIGKKCRIEAFAFLPTGVILEDNVFIGPHVCFTNDRNPPSNEWQRIIVKRGAKIGANATLLAGITIGEDAVIGMGAVVLKDVEPNTTVVGNPAKVIKYTGFGSTSSNI